MSKKAYCIFDTVAKDVVGGIVMLVPGETVAVRNFADAVLMPNSNLARHPDDYVLVYLGTLAPTSDGGKPVLYIDDNTSEVVMSARSILAAQQTPNDEGR